MRNLILSLILINLIGCDEKKESDFDINVKKTAWHQYKDFYSSMSDIHVVRIDTVYVDQLITDVYAASIAEIVNSSQSNDREILELKSKIESNLILGLKHEAELNLYDLKELERKEQEFITQLKRVDTCFSVLQKLSSKYKSYTAYQVFVNNSYNTIEKVVFTDNNGNNLMIRICELQSDSMYIPLYLKELFLNGKGSI